MLPSWADHVIWKHTNRGVEPGYRVPYDTSTGPIASQSQLSIIKFHPIFKASSYFNPVWSELPKLTETVWEKCVDNHCVCLLSVHGTILHCVLPLVRPHLSVLHQARFQITEDHDNLIWQKISRTQTAGVPHRLPPFWCHKEPMGWRMVLACGADQWERVTQVCFGWTVRLLHCAKGQPDGNTCRGTCASHFIHRRFLICSCWDQSDAAKAWVTERLYINSS